MKTKDFISVSFTGKEFFERICFEAFQLLTLNVPNIETVVDKESIQIVLEPSNKNFKLIFICQVRSVVGGEVQKILDCKLVFQAFSITEKIIDDQLEKRKIVKAANLNCPIANLKFFLGSVSSTDTTNILSFDFSMNYDDPRDYQ